MTDTIFDEPSNTITIPTELDEMVGEGKKYASVEEALKSVPHAQSHIQKLEEEAKQLREELAKRKAAEELLDEFKSQANRGETKSTTLDPNELAKIVENALSSREVQKVEQNNISKVVAAFNEKFGEKGPEQYKKIAEESGLPLEYLNKLAATSPQAVLKLAGFTSQTNIPGKTQSSVNTESLPHINGTENLSVKVKSVGASTKDLVAAWRNADRIVKQELGIKE